ncbi:DUF6783 domain-containing protein [Robinsoniella peoriensis]|uniref:DUF6783 domain-containing protein n=1 Tax=Robinsoniella peoriensis TaxID=180332 RepID=UPI0029075275|nr:DUF6783 domain-containing protein [Clostridiales bacterium]
MRNPRRHIWLYRPEQQHVTQILYCRKVCARACLKIHSCHLHAPLCGIFAPNSGCVARYAPFIRNKSPTNCDAQVPESNFKTRSRACSPTNWIILCNGK